MLGSRAVPACLGNRYLHTASGGRGFKSHRPDSRQIQQLDRVEVQLGARVVWDHEGAGSTPADSTEEERGTGEEVREKESRPTRLDPLVR